MPGLLLVQSKSKLNNPKSNFLFSTEDKDNGSTYLWKNYESLQDYMATHPKVSTIKIKTLLISPSQKN
jgi:hypothetical protein